MRAVGYNVNLKQSILGIKEKTRKTRDVLDLEEMKEKQEDQAKLIAVMANKIATLERELGRNKDDIVTSPVVNKTSIGDADNLGQALYSFIQWPRDAILLTKVKRYQKKQATKALKECWSLWDHKLCKRREDVALALFYFGYHTLVITGDLSKCSSETLIFEDESEKGSNALLARAWSPGWSNADKALAAFINGPLLEYSKNRRKADSATTSFLSPHLHFGELSVRKVFHLLRIKQVLWANEGNTAGEESVNIFLKSIGLREYSRYMSFNHPYSHERPLLGHLKFFPWVIDEGYFKAWRQGRTGYPLVDAGMRELWATGWLHDRIRVVVSSFFVKVLQLPWRWGMKYFWDTLLDADLESDALGWQYITGTLPDGREFDRIDNPQFEGYKFDPNGEYVRRWLPELARLPTEWIHHPWDAPEYVLQAAGIELGSNYPLPIVKLDAAKARLQEALTQMWQHEASSRAILENGIEEGLGDSSEAAPIAFPQDMDMEMDDNTLRTNPTTTTIRHYEDQMVPSMTTSLFRGGEEESSSEIGNLGEDSRAEVPINQGGDGPTARTENLQPPIDITRALRIADDLPANSSDSSSSSSRERDGGVVPVWSPSNSSFTETFVGEESSYLQRRTQSHQLINWRRLSQTG
ncbi:hypothetical protein L1887_21027 [Cichorium endivia]|nr:hypothetical protein L1887_21027 [Cichorium endivia]